MTWVVGRAGALPVHGLAGFGNSIEEHGQDRKRYDIPIGNFVYVRGMGEGFPIGRDIWHSMQRERACVDFM